MIRALRSKSTIVAFISGIVGILLILWAWQLPPFVSAIQVTNNAAIKGNVTPISSQISGVIARVHVQDYQRVERGQVLFELDDAVFQQQLVRAKANLDSKNTKLAYILLKVEALQGEIKIAEAELAHLQEISASKSQIPGTNKPFHAVPSLSQSLATLEMKYQLQKQLDFEQQSLQFDIMGARAGVELAELNLSHAKIISPDTGYIGLVGVKVGQYVMPGTQLVFVISDDIWILAHYKETQLSRMRVGQPVVFSVDALNDQKLTGHVVSFAPATGSEFSFLKTDKAIGNFIKVAQRISVRIALDPEQSRIDRLIPGMSVVTYVDTAAQATSLEE
ncbi:hypothetical protein X471_00845 [Bartonella bacilliformis str. Heidi Mejia]|uniref:Auxiliary transport protein, membrane fusion protein (MFP) family n=2 Tax=Bartonella bacilliformis TaxID=774 RepID=A1UR52_BARBK|nr:HlyD family secretion protein [Bartonella bacilliformis]ABM44503.1 auxiliary transport protein, membrane fusion protein (MFP) family [Bartonella bacilliformis KC583]AMG85346.1 HlyD family secretion protein [Bartonella bacilliformis]EKS46011.1 MFP family transporter [Bartonella bacilliformis INS]EYS88751.1 hypothetical protein X472_00838 [Bartonella bacilliformis San Pedro600-02]EYS90713.1 hypothetical protein X471_00845 [Bartonella bacilliformis str. Heidi Mejia]